MLTYDKDSKARSNILTQLDAALQDKFAILSHSFNNNVCDTCVCLYVYTCTHVPTPNAFFLVNAILAFHLFY